jgi:hypothetical protein
MYANNKTNDGDPILLCGSALKEKHRMQPTRSRSCNHGSFGLWRSLGLAAVVAGA